MKELKFLLTSAEQQDRAIEKKIDLSESIHQKGNVSIAGHNGYHKADFTGERKDKILALIDGFIKEDQAALEPLTTKLNLISDLIKGDT
jgi:hypothetical protein